MDSTNYRLKYFFKNPESSKKQNLNLLHAGNNLHSIYIVVYNYFHGIYIVLDVISNLEMT